MSLLAFDDVTLKFGGVTALNGVSFDVARGELLAVIGPNGAGKSSVFNCISGVYRPQQGTIAIDGESLVGARRRSAQLGIGRTFQNLGLFGPMTTEENLLVGRHQHMRSGMLEAALWFGRARKEEEVHRAAVHELLELLDLTRHKHTPVAVLPYGVQKRIELGRALAMDPRVLLLDEPVAGMNDAESEEMAGHLKTIRTAKPDLAVVLVEHDMPFVMGLADRVVVLDFGKVIAKGSPAEVQADDAVLDAYLGVE